MTQPNPHFRPHRPVCARIPRAVSTDILRLAVTIGELHGVQLSPDDLVWLADLDRRTATFLDETREERPTAESLRAEFVALVRTWGHEMNSVGAYLVSRLRKDLVLADALLEPLWDRHRATFLAADFREEEYQCEECGATHTRWRRQVEKPPAFVDFSDPP